MRNKVGEEHFLDAVLENACSILRNYMPPSAEEPGSEVWDAIALAGKREIAYYQKLLLKNEDRLIDYVTESLMAKNPVLGLRGPVNTQWKYASEDPADAYLRALREARRR